MRVCYRRAVPSDIARWWPTVRSEWGLFSAPLLRRVPSLIAELVASDRLTMCVFEESETKTPMTIGGFGFLARTFIDQALSVEGKSLLEQAFDAEARSTPAFLGRRQIVVGNRRRDLEMVNFMAAPPKDGADRVLWVSAVYDAWQFFVKGFQLNGVWQENMSLHLDEPLLSAGYRIVRRVHRSTSEVVTLFHTSRSDGGGMMGSLIASVMTSPFPVFEFTHSEQRLLECALLDNTDQEIADILHVTPDAIKKRWRNIHAKVMTAEPATLRGITSALGRRRAILGRVRPRLEELRPYR